MEQLPTLWPVVLENWFVKSPPAAKLDNRKSWQKRYFVLIRWTTKEKAKVSKKGNPVAEGCHCIMYWKNEEDRKKKKNPIRILPLNEDCNIQIKPHPKWPTKYEHVLRLKTPLRSYFFCADTRSQLMEWYLPLKEIIKAISLGDKFYDRKEYIEVKNWDEFDEEEDGESDSVFQPDFSPYVTLTLGELFSQWRCNSGDDAEDSYCTLHLTAGVNGDGDKENTNLAENTSTTETDYWDVLNAVVKKYGKMGINMSTLRPDSAVKKSTNESSPSSAVEIIQANQNDIEGEYVTMNACSASFKKKEIAWSPARSDKPVSKTISSPSYSRTPQRRNGLKRHTSLPDTPLVEAVKNWDTKTEAEDCLYTEIIEDESNKSTIKIVLDLERKTLQVGDMTLQVPEDCQVQLKDNHVVLKTKTYECNIKI